MSAAQGKWLNENKATITTLSNENLDKVTTPGFYNAGGGNSVTNKPSGVDNFGMIVVHSASGDYYTQIVYAADKSYRRVCSNGTWGNWSQDILTDTKYTHPTYNAKASGLYKVTVDGTGHVSAVAAVTKADITGLGIPGSNTTYNAATTTTPGLMSAADKAKLDGIAAGANKYTYTHPNSGVTAGTYKSVTVDAQGHVTGGSNPTTLAGYGITDAAKSSHSHKASDITDNIPASKISGVLSLDNIPKAALERQVPVADDTARFKLTTGDVQNGDVVKVKSTGLMYFVTDQTKLNSADGYMEFTAGSAASVPWTGVTGKPSTFTPSSHKHAISDITSLQDALNGKAANKTMTAATASAAGTAGLVPAPAAGKQGQYLRGDGTWSTPTNTTYNDATTSTHGLMTAADKTKLDGIASGANNYTHPSSHPLSMITETDNLKVMTADERTKLAGIAANANNYTHPGYTAKSSGLYKVTVDSTGHVSAVAAVTKADITALGIPGQDTNTTYNDATTSAHGLMTAADKVKLNGIATNANNYTHPTYTAKSSGLYKVTVDGTGHVSGAVAVTKSDITALGIPGQDTNTDTKVTQTAIKSSDYTNWRTVLWGSSNSGTEGFAPETVTDSVFSDTNLTYQPSSGTLKAKIFKGSLSGNASTASNVAWSGVTGKPSSMPASDVYAWAKASSKPSYSKSEVGLGNVDNTADANKSVKYATSAGSAGSATKATQDSAGQQINTTYIKGLSVSGRTITYTRGDNTTGTITTQDTDTNTWRPVQNNLTSTATDQSLSAAQGKILNDRVQERLVRSEWNCTIKCATWSRLCYVAAKTGIAGSSFIINVSATRGSVVYHDTFAIKAHHSSSALISKISGSKYGSSIQIRVLVNTNGDCYVDLYDAANSATNSTTQSVNCTLLQISCGALTKYTSFTDGSSIPSGYSNAASLITNSNSLQGNLTWAEITGKPGSMPASDVYAWAKASSKPSYSKSEVGLGNVDNTADSAKSVKYATSAGSAGSATKATQDSGGQQINSTYIKGLSVSGRTITYTKGDNTTGTITTQDTNTTYNDVTTSAHGLMTAADKTKLDGIASGANKYVHPSYTAKASGLYKVTVDASGHVSAATAVTKADITALGIPAQDTNTTYSTGTASVSGLTKLYTGTGSATDGTITQKAITDALNGKSGTGHTHNYAGSSSAGGVANSAAKLSTARTVSGGTDITMSFNYDGSGNSDASIGYYSSSARNGNTNNYPFHRFAKLDTVISSYTDKTMTVFLTQDFNGGAFGIARISLRTNNVANKDVSQAEVKWLVRSGFNADAIQIGIYNVAGSTYADAFLKLSGSYCGTAIRAIANGARGNISRTWTLVNSNEVDSTTSSDPKTSTECYVNIATAGTKLHNRSYSATVSGSDSGTTSYANGAGSASRATQDSAGQQINTTYIKGLSVNGKTITYTKGDGTTGTITTQDTNTTYSAFKAATSSAAGGTGLVPAPAAGKQGQYLRGDGTWATPTNTTYSDATTSAHGLMSAADKTKLNGIATGANKYTHPTTSGNKHIPSGGSSGQILKWSSDGTATWAAETNTWRGIQNNLTSTSTDQSLSAYQGKVLNDKFGSYTAKSSKVSATLSASSWSGSGPYTITVTVSGVTTSNNVEVLIPGSATDAQVEAWMAAGIVNGTQAANSITLKAYGDKPSINIPIECIIRKDI